MRVAILTALALLLGPTMAFAGDAAAGAKKVAQVCANCHGADGLAKIAEAPNLAGQNEMYIAEQLAHFKEGSRNNEMMAVVVKDLTDDDIANLAAYYSSIEIKVVKVPGG